MKSYVAYLRVSTRQQQRSGLSLEAQQSAALATCRQQNATLIVATLDRLSRSTRFISGLLESGVDFIAVDMPEANRLTIHILAAVAEHEREMISQRTKVALAAAKARGTKLGSPRPEIGSAKGNAVIKARAEALAVKLQPVIAGIQAEGITTLRGIARALNQRGITTAQGGEWQATQVGRLLGRLKRGRSIISSSCYSDDSSKSTTQ